MIIIKNKTLNIGKQKKEKVQKCNLKSVVTTRTNGRISSVEGIYECTTEEKKKSLINKKDASFAIKVDILSKYRLDRIINLAKAENLKVEKIREVGYGEYLVFGKSDKYDVVLLDACTQSYLGTRPVYSLNDDFTTALNAVKAYAKKVNKKRTSSFDDVIIMDDWFYANGKVYPKNSASDVYVKTPNKKIVLPGILSTVCF